AVDVRRTMVGVTDGTSNTIIVGHGNIQTGSYGTAVVAGYSNTILTGGTADTARGTPSATGFVRDSTSANYSWGGPFPQGALMCMLDGTVRMWTYTGATVTNLIAALTPNN